jgi:hypothetical protein
MMKRILAGSLALAVLCTGCSSVVVSGETVFAENDVVQEALSTREAYLNGEKITDAAVTEMALYNWEGICDDMLLAVGEEDPVLEYFDFDREQWIPLCSKSNCQHDSDSCNSWLGDGDYTGFMMQEEKIIYFTVNSEHTSLSMMQFDTKEQQQEKICDVRYPEDIILITDPGYFYYIGDQVYFIVDIWGEGDAPGEEVHSSYLTVVNWEKGTIQKEISAPEDGMGFLGVYQNKLVCTGSEVGEGVLTEEEYYAQYGAEGDYDLYLMDSALTTSIWICDMEDESWTELMTFPDYHDVDYPVPWNLYGEYFFYSTGSQVYTLSVETGETALLFTGESEQISLESICCDGLFYIEYSQTDPWYCFYDFASGCGYHLGEFDSSGNPYAETRDYLIQERVQYISKEDYFAGDWSGWKTLSQ